MTTRLREQQDRERRETLANIVVLDATRHLIRSGATPLDAAAAWGALADEAAERAEDAGARAVAEGESYAAVARALGLTRQATSKRYRHLSAVS